MCSSDLNVSLAVITPSAVVWLEFGMKDAKPAKTPMGTEGHVDLNKGGKSVDQKAYRSMIGSLLYLCASRPDIMLSVCMCARFQSDPKECHLVAVKRISIVATVRVAVVQTAVRVDNARIVRVAGVRGSKPPPCEGGLRAERARRGV